MANQSNPAKSGTTTSQSSIFDMIEKPTEQQIKRLNKILTKLKEAAKLAKLD